MQYAFCGFSLVASIATDDVLYMNQNSDGSLAESRVPLV